MIVIARPVRLGGSGVAIHEHWQMQTTIYSWIAASAQGLLAMTVLFISKL